MKRKIKVEKTPISMSKNKTVGYYNPHRGLDIAHPMPLNEPSQKEIAHSVKPVDKEDSNIEAEKGELIMKPGMDGLYKIKGKTHAAGGTPLSVDPGSFIFSNDPTLALKPTDAELFNLDEFKSKAPSKNTPAKVLEREVRPKKYNSFIATLQDPNADKIAKVTAALMLEKYKNTIGQIAFIQEAQKNEPIPPFAMGTAPLMQPDLMDAKDREDQYQKGGYTDPWPKVYRKAKTPAGTYSPRNIDSGYDFPKGDPREFSSDQWGEIWKAYGIDVSKMSPQQAQVATYDYMLKNEPEAVTEMWNTVGLTNFGRDNLKKIKELGIPLTTRKTKAGIELADFADATKLTPAQLKSLGPLAYADNKLGYRTLTPNKIGPLIPKINTDVPPPTEPNVTPQNPNPAPADKTQPNFIPSLGYDVKGKLTQAQQAHLGFLGLQAMSTNRYYPKREQVDLPEVDLNTINAQPYLNSIDNQSFQAYRTLGATDPRMARVNASSLYGRGLDAKSQALGNIDNQNTQIQNQENLTNLQQRTNQVLTNTQYDDRYFDQVQTTRENADTERRYANNQVFSTLNQYQSQADALAWGLASQYKYGRRLVVDPKTGKQYYKPTPLFEATGSGIRYNSDVADINLASGADRLNSMDEAMKILQNYGIPATDYKSVQALGNFVRAMGQSRNPLYATNPMLPNQ